jgi:hypothetical protein
MQNARSDAGDFDFLTGDWQVSHHRLKERLAGSTQWEDFGGSASVRKILGGQGNMDDNVIELPAGTYRAVTLRSFDPTSGQWAIWWLDARNPHHLDPPMRGAFVDGVGTFFADDTYIGKPIRVRFIWSDITPTSCRWQQAFSPDAGQTWETNWIMDFKRLR